MAKSKKLGSETVVGGGSGGVVADRRLPLKGVVNAAAINPESVAVGPESLRGLILARSLLNQLQRVSATTRGARGGRSKRQPN